METTGRELTILTEKDVQKVGLSALRSYYRFRVKAGAPELISDVRGAGGIIADVQYSFPEEDGARFMATLEATAADSKEEVYYQRRLSLLLIDSLASGSFLAALLYIGSHAGGWNLVAHYPIFVVVLVLLAAVLMGGALFFLVLQTNRRYRYIYAVEQFKQYHADEQWIAISEGVFPSHQNQYYQELRRQCVQYGFGLIQVNRERKPHIIITPARREVFRHSRRDITLFTPKQLDRMQRGGAVFREQLKKITAGLPLPSQLQQLQMPKFPIPGIKKLPAQLNPADPTYLFRFKRSYRNQMVVMGFAILTIAGVGWREFSQRPKRLISQTRYTKEVIASKEARGREPIFTIDPFDTIYIRPYDTTVVPYFALLRSERMIVEGFTPRVANEILIGMFQDVLILYDCERLYNFQTSKYMVQEGAYRDFESASQRMSQLLLLNLEVNCLWLGCFNQDKNQYVLYFGLLQNTLPEAQNLAKVYQKRLTALQLKANISVRMLSKHKK